MSLINNFLSFKDYYTLIEEVFTRRVEYIDDVMAKLRERGFCLQEYEVIKPQLEFEVEEKYQKFLFMVKRTKFDKEKPLEDEFDFTLLIGIDYHRKKSSRVPLYLNRTKIGTYELKWHHSHTNFKERKATVSFPGYMTIEERKTWRADYGRVMSGKKPTDFFREHLQAIRDLNPNFRFLELE